MTEPTETPSFEQALERLEVVVRDLENPETGLDRSLERYEEGVRLLNRCRAILDEAERKIRLLTGVDAEGSPITKEFDSTPTAEREADRAREPTGRSNRSTGRGTRRAPAEPVGDGEQLF